MEGQLIQLPVGLIGWSQDSIADHFKTGKELEVAIKGLRKLNLEQRKAIVATYDVIGVVNFEEQGWITIDNRRLFVFRSVLPPETEITVKVATYWEAQQLRNKLTTLNEGATIVVRPNRYRT